MAVSYDIDPQDPKTWRNHPAPAIEPRYVEELGRIGGGLLRFQWGQEARRFYAGEMRILYTDDRIEPVVTHEPDYYAVRELETGEVTRVNSYAEMLNYDRSRYEHVYRAGKSTAEFIGQPLWFVEQFRPAHLIDTPANWERNRYGEWEDPATGRHYHHFDLLGPYPSGGRWDAFFVVGEPTGEKDPFGGRVMKYRPVAQDVIESVRRRLYAREHEKLASAGQQLKDRYDEQVAREEKQKAELADRIRQELRPHKHRFLEFGAMAGYTPALGKVKDFKRKVKSVSNKTR